VRRVLASLMAAPSTDQRALVSEEDEFEVIELLDDDATAPRLVRRPWWWPDVQGWFRSRGSRSGFERVSENDGAFFDSPKPGGLGAYSSPRAWSSTVSLTRSGSSGTCRGRGASG
jgi:hypothetical protein